MRLTNQDASFLYGETASGPMHGSSFCVFEGVIPFATVLEQIGRRLHLVPRYRQKLAFVPLNLAHARWVDDPDFKLENHIALHKLPVGSSLQGAIDAGVALAEPLLPRDRPLWMTYVLEGVPDRTVLLFLGHHAMVDGASAVEILSVLMDVDPTAEQLPPLPPWQVQPVPGALELLGEAFGDNLRALAEQNPLLASRWDGSRNEMLRRGTEVILRMTTTPVIAAPWNASPVGPKRKFVWTRYSLADFRRIRTAFGGTVNDVVLTAVVEAAARYLRFHNENTREGQMRVMCPVNVRREDESGALGNRVSAMFPMFQAKPMGVVDRLASVREETERIKANREPQALELMMESAPTIAPAAMAQTLWVGSALDPTALAARMPLPVPPRTGVSLPHFGYNFVCTNVPFMQVPQYIQGHKLLDLVAELMLSGMVGYGVAVCSYNKELAFCLTSDPRLLPDVDRMRSYLDEAFGELLQEARRHSAREAAA